MSDQFWLTKAEGASRQHCVKIGVSRAILTQRTRHLDSIIANALRVSDFIDSIDP